MTDEIDHSEPGRRSETDERSSPGTASRRTGGAPSAPHDVVAAGGMSALPFEDLVAPLPLASAPPLHARWIALGATLLAGLLGGLVGYGIGDLIGQTAMWSATGGAIGGITAATGVGIVANLTLRAMNEWKAVKHPEQVL